VSHILLYDGLDGLMLQPRTIYLGEYYAILNCHRPNSQQLVIQTIHGAPRWPERFGMPYHSTFDIYLQDSSKLRRDMIPVRWPLSASDPEGRVSRKQPRHDLTLEHAASNFTCI
jgi:hypothetical protein